jgi:hypothetical protein
VRNHTHTPVGSTLAFLRPIEVLPKKRRSSRMDSFVAMTVLDLNTSMFF